MTCQWLPTQHMLVIPLSRWCIMCVTNDELDSVSAKNHTWFEDVLHAVVCALVSTDGKP